MSVKITATLYHANWCGHCKNFMPEWSSFVSDVKKGKIKHSGVTFSSDQLEESQINAKNNAKINGEPIRGFPTIKISVTSGGRTKEFEYQGKRRAAELASFLKIVADREASN